MTDFLKANPFISMNDYLYKLSIAKTTLIANDFTHIQYLSEKQIEKMKEQKAPVISSAQDLMSFLKR